MLHSTVHAIVRIRQLWLHSDSCLQVTTRTLREAEWRLGALATPTHLFAGRGELGHSTSPLCSTPRRPGKPGSYENSGDVVDCTPLEYAQRFPGSAFPGSNRKTLLLLSDWSGSG
jgi:hypothetical protein